MKVSKITSIDRRYVPTKVSTYGIISYGDYSNNYPQEIKKIVSNSITGSSCLRTYSSFIKGCGFVNNDLVNNQNINKLLPLIADDLALYGGFALAINYDANIEISSVYHIPFEQVRLSYNRKGVKIHPDWTKENTRIKEFDPKDIVNLPFYNPENVLEEVIDAGGWDNYKGQCYYYSNKGDLCYPLPIFDAALVDMSTEEAISDITHRNAKNGFNPAGLLVNISADSDTEDSAAYIQALQGSQNAAKIGYCQVANETEIPRFVSFSGTNYDKEYSVSREAVKQNIIKAFGLPPILASEDIGSGFGAELISNSYKFYNALTRVERNVITEAFTELFPDYDWNVIELKYDNSNQDILTVLLNENISNDLKKRIFTTLFKISEKETEELLGGAI